MLNKKFKNYVFASVLISIIGLGITYSGLIDKNFIAMIFLGVTCFFAQLFVIVNLVIISRKIVKEREQNKNN